MGFVKNKSIWLILISMTLILFLAQNCADYSIVPSVNKSAVVTKTQGTFCSLPLGDKKETLNIIFMIDMSGSNVRNGDNPTDTTGLRFDVINTFLSSTCLEQYKDTNFSVVGFTDQLVKSTGGACSLTDWAAGPNKKQSALAQLQYLRDEQETEKTRAPGYYKMTHTNYNQGLTCINGLVSSHVASLTPIEKKNNNYLAFFFTDGQPTDLKDSSKKTASDYKTLFSSKYTQFMNKSNTEAGGGKLQPLFYGYNKMDSTDRVLADEVLDDMANKGGSIKQSISDFNSLDLCNLLRSGSQVRYEVAKFGAVNLTALMHRGQLRADSDMDGIPDEYEQARGFNSRTRRSQVNNNELIDGLCGGLPANACPISTSCTEVNALGLTNCDIAAFGLSDGLDSDEDKIPDLVELLKASSPNTDDVLNDIDGDEMFLFEELNLGRDPFFSDADLPQDFIIDVSHQKELSPIENCPVDQESWTFEIKNMPLVPTQATENSHASDLRLDFLNHGVDDNVIFIYYLTKKVNDPDAGAELFGQFIKVNYNLRTFKINKFFDKIGDINGNFEALP